MNMSKFENIINNCINMANNATDEDLKKMREIYEKHMQDTDSCDFEIMLPLETINLSTEKINISLREYSTKLNDKKTRIVFNNYISVTQSTNEFTEQLIA